MTATFADQELVRVILAAAEEKLATRPTVIDVSSRLVFVDTFVVVSASSERQVAAIASEIVDRVCEAGFPRPRLEGREESTWVLVDCGEVVAHVMLEDQRAYYALERLWADCEMVAVGQ